MQRAAVLIGVSKTESLPTLQAVEAGVAQMRAWAESQGIAGDRLVVLTDRDKDVRAYEVADAVKALVQRRDLDQLIVYFSGHGVYNGGDIWLLSGAPGMASEAVNVEGSIQTARTCGVSRVVILADACRVAPEGIQALGVQGIDIFPNDPVDGRERPVDVYFACARGMPALEVRDAAKAAREFSGIYTEVLAECLEGQYPDTLEFGDEDGPGVAQVRTLKLATKLEDEVPLRLAAKLDRVPTVNQTPVARIDAHQGWVSRLPVAGLPAPHRDAVEVLGGAPDTHTNTVEAADRLLKDVLAGHPDALDNGLLGGAPGWSGERTLLSMATRRAAFSKPLASRIRCGMRVRGARVRAVHGHGLRHRIATADARLVEVDADAAPASVLLDLELDDGARVGVLVPAVPDFIAELEFTDGELAHLAYAPAPPDTPNDAFEAERTRARALLAVVAATAGMGVLRLSPDTRHRLDQALHYSMQPDPSLMLYAAYAYHDSGRRIDILRLWRRLERELGFVFYDIALLAGRDVLTRAKDTRKILPAVPMLSRGWSLLKAFRADVPPLFEDLQASLRPSMWTLFDAGGTERLVAAIDDGRIA